MTIRFKRRFGGLGPGPGVSSVTNLTDIHRRFNDTEKEDIKNFQAYLGDERK